MRTKAQSTVVLLWATLILCWAFSVEGQETGQRDWLFGKQIELYAYLLREPQISGPVRDKLQEGFHRFAFEYWLLCRTTPEASSPWWRYQIRQMLHREAKNQRYFDDPATLGPFFKDGKVVQSIAVVPVAGLETAGLAETNYRTLVNAFRSTYFDATNVFPVTPIPSTSVIAGGTTAEHSQLAERISRKAWPLTRRYNLPVQYQDQPYGAFEGLSITGRVYYLPAFLLMCESESDRVGDLPNKMIGVLSADTPESVELRSKLTQAQRMCIVAFFDAWFKEGDAPLLKRLREQMGLQGQSGD